jgi:hypothetical protein
VVAVDIATADGGGSIYLPLFSLFPNFDGGGGRRSTHSTNHLHWLDAQFTPFGVLPLNFEPPFQVQM